MWQMSGMEGFFWSTGRSQGKANIKQYQILFTTWLWSIPQTAAQNPSTTVSAPPRLVLLPATKGKRKQRENTRKEGGKQPPLEKL